MLKSIWDGAARIIAATIFIVGSVHCAVGDDGQQQIPLSVMPGVLGKMPTAADVGVLVDAFDERVFRSEDGRWHQYMARWQGAPMIPLRVDPVLIPAFNQVRPRLNVIEYSVGYKFQVQPPVPYPSEAAGLNVRVTPREQMPDGACRGGHLVGGAGAIYSDIFIVEGASPDTILRCLLWGLPKNLGLLSAGSKLLDTFAANIQSRKYDGLTWTDVVLLRALYHPRLGNLRPRTEAMQRVEKIIREIVSELPGGG